MAALSLGQQHQKEPLSQTPLLPLQVPVWVCCPTCPTLWPKLWLGCYCCCLTLFMPCFPVLVVPLLFFCFMYCSWWFSFHSLWHYFSLVLLQHLVVCVPLSCSSMHDHKRVVQSTYSIFSTFDTAKKKGGGGGRGKWMSIWTTHLELQLLVSCPISVITPIYTDSHRSYQQLYPLGFDN